ncbi:MAG: ROK family protein [Fibrobacterota bacterium]
MDAVLGIDIGGTNTVIGLVDRNGSIITDTSVPTRGYAGFEEYLAAVKSEVDILKTNYQRYSICGAGIGAPDANHYTGVVAHAVNLDWECPVDLKSGFSVALGVPVAVTNDANASAYGELCYGAGRGVSNLLQFTLGTGFGSGVIIDGKILAGATGFAGEIGHSILIPQGRKCGCGRRGCVETYVSATGICRTVQELLCTYQTSSVLRSIPADSLTSKTIYHAACDGDELALKAFDKTGEWLAWTAADAVTYLSPEVVVLFGGLAHAGDLLMTPFRHYYDAYCMEMFKGSVRFGFSELKEADAALLGCAGLMWDTLNEKA